MDSRIAQAAWRRLIGGPADAPLTSDEAWEAIMGGTEGDRVRNELAESLDDTRSWVDPNGYRLSDRIWRARQSDRDAIDRILRQSLANGDSPLDTARTLTQYLTPQASGGAPGSPGSGKGLYAARRLARTETTRAFGQATIEAVKRTPFVRAVRWNLSGGHDPKEDHGVCAERAHGHSRGLARGEYLADEVPRYPGHPNCRCYLSPEAREDVETVIAELRQQAGLEAPSDQLHAIRTSRDAELEMEKLGVRASFDNRSNIANLVTEGLLRVAEKGSPLPAVIRVEPGPFVELGKDALRSVPALYQPGEDALILNPLASFWSYPDVIAQREYDFGFWVSPDPHSLLYHELGHVAHLRPGVDASALQNWPEGAFDALNGKVSEYAMVSPTEFVAEVFAGMMSGRGFEDVVLEWYRRFGGFLP